MALAGGRTMGEGRMTDLGSECPSGSGTGQTWARSGTVTVSRSGQRKEDCPFLRFVVRAVGWSITRQGKCKGTISQFPAEISNLVCPFRKKNSGHYTSINARPTHRVKSKSPFRKKHNRSAQGFWPQSYARQPCLASLTPCHPNPQSPFLDCLGGWRAARIPNEREQTLNG